MWRVFTSVHPVPMFSCASQSSTITMRSSVWREKVQSLYPPFFSCGISSARFQHNPRRDRPPETELQVSLERSTLQNDRLRPMTVGTRKRDSHHTRRTSLDEQVNRMERERLDSEKRPVSVLLAWCSGTTICSSSNISAIRQSIPNRRKRRRGESNAHLRLRFNPCHLFARHISI